jgi:CheY-like chemotaxis protein
VNKSLRVLIVEDETLIAMLIEDMVIELGHRVVAVCARLRDGLEKATGLDFDLAIVDVHLPDGISAPIVSALDGRSVPCVISSAYRDIPAPVYANRSRVFKPFGLAALAEAISQARASTAPRPL